MALSPDQHDALDHAQRSMLKRLEAVDKLLSDAALELANVEESLQQVHPGTLDPAFSALSLRAFDIHRDIVAVQQETEAVIDALNERLLT